MSPTLQFLLLTGIIIFAAKTGGLVSTRLKQPAVLGELVAGLILGPTALNLLGQAAFAASNNGEMIAGLAEVGVIFLMFLAGLEVDLEDMLRSGRVSVLAGVLGVLLPLVLGTVSAFVFQYPLLDSIFVGLILTATSVSISAQTLLELGVLRSKEGLALLGAAVIDDLLGILLLSLFLALTHETASSSSSVLAVVVRMGLYLVASVAVGVAFLPRLTAWVEQLPVSEGVIAFVVIVTLLYAWSAEVLGEIATITGAFIAGTLFARTGVRRIVAEGMHTLTYAFFVPIFLISIGLQADARALGGEGLLFAAVLIAGAILGKAAGCWVGARAGGFSTWEALRVAVGMISRGEVGLIIASIGLTQGWIGQAAYSTMVVMVLATTLITPILLRWVFPPMEVNRG